MAVAENAAPKNDTSAGQNMDTNKADSDNDLERSSSKPWSDSAAVNSDLQGAPQEEVRANGTHLANGFGASDRKPAEEVNEVDDDDIDDEEDEGDDDRAKVVGGGGGADGKPSAGFGGAHINSNDNKANPHDHQHDHDMSELVEILSKLNPMAEEFVPPSLASGHGYLSNGFGYANNFVVHANHGNANGHTNRRKKNNYGQGRRRMNSRTGVAQREETIRRTVYVSDIDQQVTEEQLAGLFTNCGQVVDCRVCGDPNSILRFAFIEFTDEESARAALTLSGTVLGFYPLRVLPSKTAIAPVNPTFLPRSEDEREMCARTIYCTNIDKKVTQADVRLFFESFCGEVHRLRILGDYHHSTRIAFIEFAMAESAIAALNCSGAVLGSLPIRVSPSKTPVRPRIPRTPLH